MAPHFDIGVPHRSLVRIPGSGSDKSLNLKPICLDVAQISNFQRELAEIMVFKPDFLYDSSPGTRSTNLTSISRGSLNAEQRRPAPTTSAAAPTANELPRMSRKRGNEEELRDAKRPSKSNPNSNSDLDDSQKLAKMKKLQSEKEKLQHHVQELQRKVDTFKYIIRSRSRLKNFLESLEDHSKNSTATPDTCKQIFVN